MDTEAAGATVRLFGPTKPRSAGETAASGAPNQSLRLLVCAPGPQESSPTFAGLGRCLQLKSSLLTREAPSDDASGMPAVIIEHIISVRSRMIQDRPSRLGG